jgi:hypothetical protein
VAAEPLQLKRLARSHGSARLRSGYSPMSVAERLQQMLNAATLRMTPKRPAEQMVTSPSTTGPSNPPDRAAKLACYTALQAITAVRPFSSVLFHQGRSTPRRALSPPNTWPRKSWSSHRSWTSLWNFKVAASPVTPTVKPHSRQRKSAPHNDAPCWTVGSGLRQLHNCVSTNASKRQLCFSRAFRS